MTPPLRYRSAGLVFDASTATVHGPDGPVRLRKQLAETLTLLMERAPALVSTDELLDAVWGRQAISPSAVPQAIKDLRRLIGDRVQAPIYIETRHRLGYRWMLPVEREEPSAPAPIARADAAAVPEPAQPESTPRLRTPAPAPAPTPAAARTPMPAAPDSRSRWPAIALALLVGLGVLWAVQRPASDVLPDDVQRALPARRLLQSTEVLAIVRPDSGHPLARRLRIEAAIARDEAAEARLQLDAARAALAPDDRLANGWLDALDARLQGRDVAAMQALARLDDLDRGNVDVQLALFDLRKHLPKVRALQLAEALANQAQLPAARRALVAAQRAVLLPDPAARKSAAAEALRLSADGFPVIRAQAELIAAALESDPAANATQAFAAGTALAALGETRLAARARLQGVTALIAAREFDRATRELDALEIALRERSDPVAARNLALLRATVLSRLQQDAQAVAAYRELASAFEQAGDLGAAASALNNTALPLYRQARTDEVPATLERALMLAQQGQAQDTAGFVLGSLANHYVRDGNPERAEAYYLRALEAFQLADLPTAQSTAYTNLSEIAIQRGKLEAALQYAERAQGLLPADASSSRAYLDFRLGTILTGLGRLDAAAGHADQARAAFRAAGDAKEHASATLQRGELALRQGNPGMAEQLLHDVEGLPDPGVVGRSDLLQLEARLAFMRGDFGAARRAFANAQALRNQAQERGDAALSAIGLIQAQLAIGAAVGAEEAARVQLRDPVVIEQPRLQRAARLALAAALRNQGRADALAEQLKLLDALLAMAPDAEDALHAALLRTELDATPTERSERLDWIQGQADAKGMGALALAVRGYRARQASRAEQVDWQESVRAAGYAPAALHLRP